MKKAPESTSKAAVPTRRGRPLSKVPKRLEDALIRRVAQSIGADELSAALMAQPENSKYGRLANLLTDPAFSRSDLPALARQAGVTWADLTALFRDHQLQLAEVIAARELPAVVTDITQDAQNKVRTCRTCVGEGSIEIERVVGMSADDEGNEQPIVELRTIPCLDCEGKGKTIEKGDSEARSMHLEMLDQIRKKAPTTNVYGNVGQMNLGGQQSQFVTVGQKLIEQRMSEPPEGMKPQAPAERTIDVQAEEKVP